MFYRAGLDWRWSSWSAVAQRVERLSRLLAAAGLAAAATEPGLGVFSISLALAGEQRSAEIGGADLPTGWARPGASDGEPEIDAEVRQNSPAAVPLHLPPTAAEDLLAALPPAGSQRDVLVLADPLPAPVTAAGLRWSLAEGAAVVLAETPDLALPTILWARPTVYFGRSAEAEALASSLTPKHRRRDPLGRLRLVIVEGEEPVAPDPWHRCGIEVVTTTW